MAGLFFGTYGLSSSECGLGRFAAVGGLIRKKALAGGEILIWEPPPGGENGLIQFDLV